MRRSYFMQAILFVLIFCFSSASYAGLTVTSDTEDVWGKKRVKIKSIAFDSSYAAGGESLTKASIGLAKGEQVIIEPKDGYSFEYDYTNEKVKVLTKAPPIVYEEKHTADTAGQFTLNYPAAWILNIATLNGNSVFAYAGTTTVQTNQVILPSGIDDGVRTGVSAYTPSIDYYVTYATQAWKDLYDLYTENEQLVLATGHKILTSGNSIFALGYVYNTVGGSANTVMTPIDWYDVPATTEIGVSIYPSGGNTSFNVNSSQNGDTVFVTYLKSPANTSWLASKLYTGVTSVGHGRVEHFKKPMLIWNVTGAIPANGQVTQRITHSEDTQPGAYEVIPFWGTQGPFTGYPVTSGASLYRTMFAYGGNNSGVSINGNYTVGVPGEVQNLSLLEVPDGSNLSDLTGVKVLLIGR